MAALLASALLFQSVVGRSATGIVGVTRTAEDGRPLGGVLVQRMGSGRQVISDSLGRYRFEVADAGSARVRFSFPGRVSVEVAVLLQPAGLVSLDVELSPAVARLPALVVNARGTDSVVTDDLSALRGGTEWAERRLPGSRDLQNALAALPGAASRGEATGALNFQGGESDQAGIQVDGFPVLGASHFGSALSALNPDLIGGFEARMGAAPARFGGWLSGTVLVTTTLLSPTAAPARGGINPTDLRQLIQGLLPGGAGRFLVSGRRSYRSPWQDPSIPESGNGYEDWLGGLAVPVRNGRLRLMAYLSRNQLAFPSRADAAASESMPSGGSGQAQENNLEWLTGTLGAGWQDSTPGGRTVSIRTWRAHTGSAVDWRSATTGTTLDSHFTEVGIRLDGTWPRPQGRVEAGLGLTDDRSRYSAGRPGMAPSISAASHATIMHAFVERQWRIVGSGTVRAGLRASYVAFGGFGLEPRIGVEVPMGRGVRAALEIGRTHQFFQSLRNQESFLSSVVAFDLPAGVGTAGIPTASADNLSLTLRVEPAPATSIDVRGYVRRFSGLALVPATPQPFVTAAGGVGTGTAAGAELQLSQVRGLARADFAFAVGTSDRTLANGVRYRPGFQQHRVFRTFLSLALNGQTRLGVAFQAGSGLATSLVGPVGWKAYDPVGGGELLGTPDNLDATVNGRSLPGGARLDFGVSRRSRLPFGGAQGQVTTSIAVENVLNRHNPIGLSAASPGGLPQALLGRPRTLRIEIDWRL